MIAAEFQGERWRRAGATAEELEALEARFAALGPAAGLAETNRIASESDRMLAEKLEAWRADRKDTAGPEPAADRADAADDGEALPGAHTDPEGPVEPVVE